jgi:hypothetical protein
MVVPSSRSQDSTSGFASKVQGNVNGELAELNEFGDLKTSNKSAPTGDILGTTDEQEISNKIYTDLNAGQLVATDAERKLESVTSLAPFLAASESLTISSGEITVIGGYLLNVITIDTEGGGASDDLDKINGGTLNELYVLQAANDARTVVVKDSADIQTQGTGFSLDHTADKIVLICTATDTFHELARAHNG